MAHQGPAVLGIALVAMAEDLGAAMAHRALEHLLQYGEPAARCGPPSPVGLGLGLLDPCSSYPVSSAHLPGRTVFSCSRGERGGAAVPWHAAHSKRLLQPESARGQQRALFGSWVKSSGRTRGDVHGTWAHSELIVKAFDRSLYHACRGRPMLGPTWRIRVRLWMRASPP